MHSVDLYAPQLGEHVWHAFTDDQAIGATSEAHRQRIATVVQRHLPKLSWSRARFLELGAYRHYTGNLLVAQHGCEYVATDIAAASLRDARVQARGAGVPADATAVVADFHDLPFSDGYFDAVFVASTVHHSASPEQVLREAMRVLKPAGVLILDNEPCARTCCFHAFTTNPRESFTPYEKALDAAGLLPTLSSPFWGSRPERLFGMVENDRIPLSLYTDVLVEEGQFVERRLALDRLIGPFEQTLMRLKGRGPALRREVKAMLDHAVATARHGYGATERLLGYVLPSQCEVHRLADSVSLLLEQRRTADDDTEWQARMFGAALAAVVRKRGSATGNAPGLYRRRVERASDGIVREALDSGSVAARLGEGLLPEVHAAPDATSLAHVFPPSEWQLVTESHGSHSMVNRTAAARVLLPQQAGPSLLLMRFYAVVGQEQPIRVRVWGGGILLDEQVIALSETRLVRAMLPQGCREVMVQTADLEDRPLIDNVRVGVCQLFTVGIDGDHAR